MKKQKTYWKGIEELTKSPEYLKYAEKEFPDYLPIKEGKMKQDDNSDASRRDFLKMMGFGIAAASLAACEAPVRKAIPYLNKPVEVDPGIPNYYASTFYDGGNFASVVVKTREGRPIKIEGNKLSNFTRGTKTPQAESSVLSLYDKQRFKNPLKGGDKISWEDLDKEVKAGLASAASVKLVSNTIISPTTLKAIEEFKAAYPNAEHIQYDPVSADGILTANEATCGKRMIPSYDFSKAEVIVSFGADFLGTWLTPGVFAHQYGQTRKLNKNSKMSRHYQFESNLSMTGANADYRQGIKPSQEGLYVATLYNLIASKTGKPQLSISSVESSEHLKKAANDLISARGKSLVVSGSNDSNIQAIVNAINDALSNYGKTIDTDTPVHLKQGSDKAMSSFVNQAKAGRVGAVIFFNCNPVYDYAGGSELKEAISTIGLSISTSDRPDETNTIVEYIAPDHHYLESWGDAQPAKGHFSLSQPTITPIFNSRAASFNLLAWSGSNVEDYFTYLKSHWEEKMYPAVSGFPNFQTFWDKSLYDGVFELKNQPSEESEDSEAVAFSFNSGAISSAISNSYSLDGSGIELALYEKVGIGSGAQANNPWLQELPDPITKATWDNYLTISQKMAGEMGIDFKESNTKTVTLSHSGQSVEVPVLVQPGQAEGTVGLAIGYGRTNAGKVADGVGVDASVFVQVKDGIRHWFASEGVSVEPTGNPYRIAQTQTHQTYMGRDFVIQETVLSEFQKNPSAGRHSPHIATWTSEKGYKSPGDITLWNGHKYNNHHWGLAIDMNSCIGCSNCSIACSAENNIPVVGKEEVLNRREMHWIRIDRYYSSSGDTEDKSISGLRELEKAADNPEVTFQPMMCQHCNNAPCETVCPVAATTHSSEGLNQMTYNRCIGTRYCANNCPYKVRRFNWFKYHDNDQFDKNSAMNNDLGKMVLNPDVTVRARGVMEKCTLCVQRIQAGKLKAKLEKRRPVDGDINTACAEACPTDAILFGDMNDPKSALSEHLGIVQEEKRKGVKNPRAFHVLEELSVSPNVYYLTKVRNKDLEDTEA
ncbi:MAG: TAT-variant-translocated molybdopterin oxidoreductase [Bacteroidota bacterium]